MEADWEVETGDGAPVIDACWEGFIDLRQMPERAGELPEARDLPALADALVRINSPSSQVWTSKCDLWRPGAFDPDELDAPTGAGEFFIACYIDLLPRSHRQWIFPGQAVDFCRQQCAFLRANRLQCCRIDLIIRSAFIAPDRQNLGITAYLTACGPTPQDAGAALDSALAAFVEALLHADVSSKLQWKDAGE